MPRDREFQRKKKDTRMPVRDSHAEEIAGTRQKEPDFDLRRARDAPSSAGTGRNRKYSAAVQPAAEDLQQSAFDMPQREDVSTPEEPEGRDLDRKPERESDVGGTFVQESTTPETRRRDFGYEDHRQEDSFSGNSDTGRPARRNLVARSIPARRNAAVGCTSMAISTSSVFRRELRLRNRRRNSLGQPKENRSALLSWSLPLTSCHRRQRIKKLTQARRRAERVEKKLEDAEARLPSRKKLRMETVSDPETGKAKKAAEI